MRCDLDALIRIYVLVRHGKAGGVNYGGHTMVTCAWLEVRKSLQSAPKRHADLAQAGCAKASHAVGATRAYVTGKRRGNFFPFPHRGMLMYTGGALSAIINSKHCACEPLVLG
jgi:hypothetical protein